MPQQGPQDQSTFGQLTFRFVLLAAPGPSWLRSPSLFSLRDFLRCHKGHAQLLMFCACVLARFSPKGIARGANVLFSGGNEERLGPAIVSTRIARDIRRFRFLAVLVKVAVVLGHGREDVPLACEAAMEDDVVACGYPWVNWFEFPSLFCA